MAIAFARSCVDFLARGTRFAVCSILMCRSSSVAVVIEIPLCLPLDSMWLDGREISRAFIARWKEAIVRFWLSRMDVNGRLVILLRICIYPMAKVHLYGRRMMTMMMLCVEKMTLQCTRTHGCLYA